MTDLDALGPLLGDWTCEMTHPALPGTVVTGTSAFERIGDGFVQWRATTSHPDFPDCVAVIGAGDDGALTMWYFDERAVRRVYRVAFADRTLRIWRDEPGFAQRFEGPLAADGATIDGQWQLDRGDGYADDLKITLRRASPAT